MAHATADAGVCAQAWVLQGGPALIPGRNRGRWIRSALCGYALPGTSAACCCCCCCPKKEDYNNTAVFLLGHICFKTNTRPFAKAGSGHNQTQQKLTKPTFCSCLPQDQSMRFTSLCRQVPTMSRADAEQQYRFPWKMPFAIYEPVTGKRGDRRNERNTRRLFCCTFTNAQNHNPLSAL